jgi:hypothetical protein
MSPAKTDFASTKAPEVFFNPHFEDQWVDYRVHRALYAILVRFLVTVSRERKH